MSDSDELPPLATEHEIGKHTPDSSNDEIDPITRSRLAGKLNEAALRLEQDFEPPPDDVPDKVKELHPYCTILGLSDLESCIALENATFPEHQRCSREKFLYRLSVCSELCLGVFTSVEPTSPISSAPTASVANAPDSSNPQRKGILLAHVIATKTTNDTVTDDDMTPPSNWKDPAARKAASGNTKDESESHLGHQEHGRTIAVHSLAVLPDYQKRGLGSMLMKAYVQRMSESEMADQVSLLAMDDLVAYYEKLGFENRGKSKVHFCGGAWNDLVLDFDKLEGDDEFEDYDEDFDEDYEPES